MNEHLSDELRAEPDSVRDAREQPLARLAQTEYDDVRSAVLGRLLRPQAARGPVSSFGSSI